MAHHDEKDVAYSSESPRESPHEFDSKQEKLAQEVTYADEESAATSDGAHGALKQTLKSRHMQMIAIGVYFKQDMTSHSHPQVVLSAPVFS